MNRAIAVLGFTLIGCAGADRLEIQETTAGETPNPVDAGVSDAGDASLWIQGPSEFCRLRRCLL